MSFDLIQGKRGTGKSKLAVLMMKEHMLAGRLVATNLDLFMEKLMPAQSKAVALRVPDKPKAEDLVHLGGGNNGDLYNEEHNGLLVLDELATWFNSRTFQDKERGPVLDWLVHSRKHGWEMVAICQDLVQIDKQLRESLVEYVIRCLRMDKMRIPIVGGVIAMLLGEKTAQLPKMHLAVRRLGCDPKGLQARSWWYRDAGVQEGYNTLQIFRTDYPHGTHSLLSAWHLKGRYEQPPLTFWQRLAAFAGGSPAPQPRRVAPRRPRHPIVARIEWALQDDPDAVVRHVARLARRGVI